MQRAVSAFLGQGGQAFSAVLLTVAVARAVPPSIRGEFVLLVLIPQLGSYLVTLGLPAALSRALVRNPGIRAQLLTTSLLAALACGLLMTALTPALLAVVDASRPSLALVLIGNVAATWLIFGSWFGFALQRYFWSGAIRGVPTVAGAAAIVLMDALTQPTLTQMYAAWAGAHCLVALVVAAQLTQSVGWRLPTGAELREWLGYGLRFYAYHVAQIMSLRVDQWILGALASTAAVGVYSVAATLSEAVLLAARAVGLVVFVDSARGVSRREFYGQLRGSVLVSLAGAVLLAAAAEPVARVVFGADYAAAATPLRILLLGTPALVVLRLVTTRLAGQGEPGRASICSMATLVATLALDFVLIPAHGSIGAAWASTIGYTLGGAIALAMLLAPHGLGAGDERPARGSDAPV